LQAKRASHPAIYLSQRSKSSVGSDVPQVPKTLQWQTFSGAQLYKVVVMEVIIRRSGLRNEGDVVEIPASLRAKMFPGKPILWQVRPSMDRACLGYSQFSGFHTPREQSSQRPAAVTIVEVFMIDSFFSFLQSIHPYFFFALCNTSSYLLACHPAPFLASSCGSPMKRCAGGMLQLKSSNH